ncbi:hypothetical protein [Nonomuraea sp. NPDC052265]|uniref:hypothetical protein n=1 Tax=Nonomuraea sp. NPDC052265 TaxID=3364374 RepID=UPI0037C64282
MVALAAVISGIGTMLAVAVKAGVLLYRGRLKLSLGDVQGGSRYLVEALSAALGIGASVILGIDVLRALRRRDVTRRIRPAARRTRGY